MKSHLHSVLDVDALLLVQTSTPPATTHIFFLFVHLFYCLPVCFSICYQSTSLFLVQCHSRKCSIVCFVVQCRRGLFFIVASLSGVWCIVVV